ncbi:MAG: hypothetical protein IT381_19225 [Deltaproteobacteria bacterium]|nr:hypothetical protein [Deltaproteobacteria bacterium]
MAGPIGQNKQPSTPAISPDVSLPPPADEAAKKKPADKAAAKPSDAAKSSGVEATATRGDARASAPLTGGLPVEDSFMTTEALATLAALGTAATGAPADVPRSKNTAAEHFDGLRPLLGAPTDAPIAAAFEHEELLLHADPAPPFSPELIAALAAIAGERGSVPVLDQLGTAVPGFADPADRRRWVMAQVKVLERAIEKYFAALGAPPSAPRPPLVVAKILEQQAPQITKAMRSLLAHAPAEEKEQDIVIPDAAIVALEQAAAPCVSAWGDFLRRAIAMRQGATEASAPDEAALRIVDDALGKDALGGDGLPTSAGGFDVMTADIEAAIWFVMMSSAKTESEMLRDRMHEMQKANAAKKAQRELITHMKTEKARLQSQMREEYDMLVAQGQINAASFSFSDFCEWRELAWLPDGSAELVDPMPELPPAATATDEAGGGVDGEMLGGAACPDAVAAQIAATYQISQTDARYLWAYYEYAKSQGLPAGSFPTFEAFLTGPRKDGGVGLSDGSPKPGATINFGQGANSLCVTVFMNELEKAGIEAGAPPAKEEKANDIATDQDCARYEQMNAQQVEAEMRKLLAEDPELAALFEDDQELYAIVNEYGGTPKNPAEAIRTLVREICKTYAQTPYPTEKFNELSGALGTIFSKLNAACPGSKMVALCHKMVDAGADYWSQEGPFKQELNKYISATYTETVDGETTVYSNDDYYWYVTHRPGYLKAAAEKGDFSGGVGWDEFRYNARPPGYHDATDTETETETETETPGDPIAAFVAEWRAQRANDPPPNNDNDDDDDEGEGERITEEPGDISGDPSAAHGTLASFDAAMETAENELDSMSDMTALQQMRLQAQMDRYTKIIEALSNTMNKLSKTKEAIIGNFK